VACSEVLGVENPCKDGGCAVSRQERLSKWQALIDVVVYFLIGCAVLVVVGCSGVRSGSSQQEEQGHAEASKEELLGAW
jgi:hypothetical protein